MLCITCVLSVLMLVSQTEGGEHILHRHRPQVHKSFGEGSYVIKERGQLGEDMVEYLEGDGGEEETDSNNYDALDFSNNDTIQNFNEYYDSQDYYSFDEEGENERKQKQPKYQDSKKLEVDQKKNSVHTIPRNPDTKMVFKELYNFIRKYKSNMNK